GRYRISGFLARYPAISIRFICIRSSSSLEPELGEPRLDFCTWVRHWRRRFWFADQVSGSVGRGLRLRLPVFKREKTLWRFDGRAPRQLRIKEVQHLRPEDRIMTADEDEHLAGRDDLLCRSIALFLR